MRVGLLLMLAACGGGAGDTDTGERGDDTDLPSGGLCDDTPSVVAQDAVTSLGFSAQDVLDRVAAPFVVDGQYPDLGGTTTVTISVSARAGDVIFHDREPSGDTGASFEAYAPCDDQLEIPVLVAFSSADGRFDESLETTITTSSADAVSVSADLDWAALGGTFDVATVADPAEWDTVTLDLGTTLLPEVAGQVQVSASRDLGDGMGEGLVGPVLRWP